jgi:hypothetical protein
LWIALQNNSLEPLLNKANELEKKYEWLQASKSYTKASEILLKEKDFVNAAELAERLGHCYFKAADQAETNKEFRKRMKQAVEAYKKELELLEGEVVENKQIKIIHAQALIAYVKAVLERRLLEKKKLLDEWWVLENQVVSGYEKIIDFCSAGKVCNELLEYSRSNRFWLVSNYSELQRNIKDYINLAEKAIQIFSKLNDDYELTRAYFLATYYYNFSGPHLGSKIEDFKQKSQEYSKKALVLSQKIGNPCLISESLRSNFWITQHDVLRDSKLVIDNYRKVIKYGKIAKNNFLITNGKIVLAYFLSAQAFVLEDPLEKKENLKRAIKLFQEAKNLAEVSENIVGSWIFYRECNVAINELASISIDSKTKQDLLEMAIKVNQEGMERLRGWKWFSGSLLGSMGISLQLISKTKSEIKEKRKLLQKAKPFLKKQITCVKEMAPFLYGTIAIFYFHLATIDNDLATIETENKLKIVLLKLAVKSTEKAIVMAEKGRSSRDRALIMGFGGRFYDLLGNLLVKINLMSKQENTLFKAIDSYKKASLTFEKAEMITHVAESNWHIAQVYDKLGEYQKASNKYDLAAKAYDLSSKKMPQLNEFYKNYSKYMKAWSQIEQAKYCHSIENYLEAKKNYEEAAKIYQTTNPWSYLASNYSAWAAMEEAESLSRTEATQQAKQTFQNALDQFNISEESIKQKIGEITSLDEKELSQKLLEASNLRKEFCQARIMIEDAKLMGRKGKYLQSAKSYGEAAQNLSVIVERIDIEAERRELELLSILCKAWEKMARGEETASSDLYLEAARFFEQAKGLCFTQKASLWALGNSSFCKGLAAKNQFQSTLEKSFYSIANKHVNQAADYYSKAGFQFASEYAKATQRLFDAYLYMKNAEGEIDPEKKTKYYQIAEQLLQIAAGSFMKAKQPEKTTEVQRILTTVREEKALALSLTKVMQAPTITSSTMSFVAPSPTSEVSFGLESFEHANVQANLIAANRKLRVGESFCLSVEFINAGRESALLLRVDDFVPQDFVVVKKPEIYRIEETTLNMKGKQLAPLKLVEVKLTIQPSKKGQYQLNPMVHYLDELGQNKSLQLKTIEIKVEEVVLEDRVSTGTQELDSILLGGIPKEYAVVLSGSPSDEREILVRNFLKAGAKEEVTFYIATEATGLEDMLKNPNFFLFLCNPKPKVEVPDIPNVYKLQNKTALTNLGIALTMATRSIDQTSEKPKRICVEILSDVLMSQGPNTTRKWISGLITNLISKGFIMLAVMNPAMHPSDQATAVIDLFDGEISIIQNDDPLDCKKSILVKKLRNQDYIKNPICLVKPT